MHTKPPLVALVALAVALAGCEDQPLKHQELDNGLADAAPADLMTDASADGALDTARDGSEASVEASIEASVEAGLDASSCAGLLAAFMKYVNDPKNKACNVASDCIVVGGASDCSCTPSLGPGSGVAIAKAAAAAAQAMEQKFLWDPACTKVRQQNKMCDALPAKNLRCAAGLCTADPNNCLWDASVPD